MTKTAIEPRMSLAKCLELATSVAKNRRFALLYVEYDDSICACDGIDAMTAGQTLYRLKDSQENKLRLRNWMKQCQRGNYLIVGERRSCVVVRTK